VRHPAQAISIVILAAIALAGCSNSSPSSAEKSVAIPFKSPAVVKSALSASYTCTGKNISPPLEWGAVPSTTKELALFMLNLTPNKTGGFTTTVAWAMAGINPNLHGLAAGDVPPGAHVALTNVGKPAPYSVCPAKGKSKSYQFALYAIPPSISIPAQFVGIKVLQAIADPESPDKANAGGAFVADYTRPAHAGTRTPAASKG
jgi:phosphatidylethanolamine-binding protein (PEBP) family uncharacterized protein